MKTPMAALCAAKAFYDRAPYAVAAYVIGGVSALTLAGAWFFQLVLGVLPCPFCLYERIPYYAAVPLALVLAFLARDARRSSFARAWLVLIGALFVFAAGLGAFHAGWEWGFWQGPTTCSSAALPSGGGDLLSAMNRTRVVPCDVVQWSFFGLSLAGYNALISAGLAVVALWSASQKPGR